MLKENKLTYRGIHNWVERKLGKPHLCSKCFNNKLRHRQYHWANISGEYRKDLSDWVRLCVKCHVSLDRNIKYIEPMKETKANEEQVCKVCKYKWVSRVEKPKACPDCKVRIKYK